MPEYTIPLPPEAAHLLAAQERLAAALEAAAAGKDFAAQERAARLHLDGGLKMDVTSALDLVGEKSALFTALADAHDARKAGRLVGLSTGIAEMDRLLGGLRPGLALVGAIPGGGKTAFALNCAVQAARAGKRVVYLTADEPDERLALKALCIAAGLEVGQFVDGWKHPQDLADAAAKLPWMENIVFISAHRLEPRAIVAATEGAGLLVADYVQAIASSSGSGMELRHAVDELATKLRDIATLRRIPVLALSSLNRAGYKEPGMAALRESGGLEFCADVILLLDCEAPEADIRDVTVKLQKNRFGRAFIEETLRFNPKAMTFAGDDAARYAMASAGSITRARFRK